MALDSDFGLVGTGVGVLAAASHLIAKGYSVLVLNPDRDFFLEDSELPFDPLWPLNESSFHRGRVRMSQLDEALTIVSPDFPGAIEVDLPNRKGARDPEAPYIRTRDRLWVRPPRDIDAIEQYYLQADEVDLHPQILQGISAVSRFPGGARRLSDEFGLLVPSLVDIDVARYRLRLLDYLSERIGVSRILRDVDDLTPIPSGLRFRTEQGHSTARFREGLLFFWTPKITDWVLKYQSLLTPQTPLPVSARLWEQWTIQSRDPVTGDMIGVYEDMSVWANFEGKVESALKHTGHPMISVLNPTMSISIQDLAREKRLADWGSFLSFSKLERLFIDFMKWDRFTVHSLRPRVLMDFPPGVSSWRLDFQDLPAELVTHSDGYLVQAVLSARKACDRLLNRELGA